MNKLFRFSLLLAAGIFMLTACGTKPEPAPEPQPEPVVVEEPEPEPEPTVTVNYDEYTVVKGDTLSQIAEKFYGSKDRAYFFPIIIAYTLDSFATANITDSAVNVSFADPDVIEPGLVLRIPNFESFMASQPHVMVAAPLFEQIAVKYERKGRSGVAKMLRERAQRMKANY